MTTAEKSIDELARLVWTFAQRGQNAEDEADDQLTTAEEHYITAGNYLIELKSRKIGAWAKFVKEKCGLSQTRADQLIRIAKGETTLEEVRGNAAERVRRMRERRKAEEEEEAEQQAEAEEMAEASAEKSVLRNTGSAPPPPTSQPNSSSSNSNSEPAANQAMTEVDELVAKWERFNNEQKRSFVERCRQSINAVLAQSDARNLRVVS